MEIFVIIIPPIIALIIGAVAVFAPRPKDPVAERARLHERIAWLESRLSHGREHKWDEQMMHNLHRQLAEALREQQSVQ